MPDLVPAFVLVGSLLISSGLLVLDRFWLRPREERQWDERPAE